MDDESLANRVEADITRLFKSFRDKPARFLTKSDVVCYLYHLLIFDPFLRRDPKIKNFTETVPNSKTFLIHSGLEVCVDGINRSVSLSVGEVKRESLLSAWDFPVGIEVEHNFVFSPENWIDIESDVRKLSQYKRGYLLCLNWENSLRGKHLDIVESMVAKHKSVKFFYFSLGKYSDK